MWYLYRRSCRMVYKAATQVNSTKPVPCLQALMLHFLSRGMVLTRMYSQVSLRFGRQVRSCSWWVPQSLIPVYQMVIRSFASVRATPCPYSITAPKTLALVQTLSSEPAEPRCLQKAGKLTARAIRRTTGVHGDVVFMVGGTF